MRKIFKDLMYKRGHDYDYQYDWVLKKAGQRVPEEDMAGAQQTMKAMQGKEEKPQGNGKAFIEERKENRANLGAQVINGGFG